MTRPLRMRLFLEYPALPTQNTLYGTALQNTVLYCIIAYRNYSTASYSAPNQMRPAIVQSCRHCCIATRIPGSDVGSS